MPARQARRNFLGDAMSPQGIDSSGAARLVSIGDRSSRTSSDHPRRAPRVSSLNFIRRVATPADPFACRYGADTMPTPARPKPEVHHRYLADSHEFDAHRFKYLAEHLHRARMADIAKLAERWADHHTQVARQLRNQARF